MVPVSSSYGRRRSAARGNAPTTVIVLPPPPRALLRKIWFHLAIFLSVAADLPAWSVLVYSSIADDTLFDGGMTSNPVRWPRSDPAPVLLYLLHLLAFFFLFVAMSIVLDMWCVGMMKSKARDSVPFSKHTHTPHTHMLI